MTPLGGFLRRIRGTSEAPSTRTPDRNARRTHDGPPDTSAGSGTPAERPQRARPTSETTNGASPASGEAARGRRGRRGGRGRSRPATEATSDGTAPAATTAEDKRGESRTSRNGAGKRERTEGQRATRRATKDRYNWGRRVNTGEADERSQQANRRRRDVRIRNLDQPLPEDVAFRPGDEGGDASILPSRRRRPTGLHDTARILVGGARTLGGGWVKRFEPPTPTPDRPITGRPPAPAPAAPDVEPAIARRAIEEIEAAPTVETPEDTTDLEAAESAEADRKRRRRGRRGGRGRRRPEDDNEATAADVEDRADAEAELDDDLEDHIERDISDGAVADEAAPAVEGSGSDTEASEPHDTVEERQRPRRRPRTRARLESVADEDLPAEFAGLGVSRTTLQALARFGFTDPTPIQREAIPALLNHLDVVGVAQTGSGKTIAFGVPMMEQLAPDLAEVQGLVLVPTRELAQQVLEVLQDLGEPWGLTAVGLLGGHSMRADFRALEGRPQIVVGTPGRILDHLRRQTLSLRHVSYAVLDEADQMLDIGFLPDIRRILSRTPQRRQTALFSATMPGSIKRLIWQFMTDPETVRVDPEAMPVETIRQTYFEVAQRDKVRGLRELVERELRGRTLIFSNTKRGVDHVARELERDGVRVGALHGDMDQRRRDRVVQDFREGSLDVLIATNVAARGLDIPEITHVVNYDVPQNREEYVHRIGRTGRAGREGRAITLVSEWDIEAFDTIRHELGIDIPREQLDLYSVS